ncbi:sugar-binding protein [Klebsiella pneumoniae]|nr:sugar-binding protein [Klebsiella pneumoniae]
MKNVLISATLSATLGLSAFSSLAQDVDLRMSWWGGNGRHQVTLKALEEFHKQNPDINVKGIHRLGRPSFTPDHPDCRRYRA